MTISSYYADQPKEAREKAEARLHRLLQGAADGSISTHQAIGAKMEALWNDLGLPDRITAAIHQPINN